MERAASVTGPEITAECEVSIGGVDPLGLRQINFDMMDQILPGLNNVARHIRPYILMTWAWRQCNRLAAAQKGAKVDEMRDFVDRIETIYAWSQFVIDPDTDLPGRQALAKLSTVENFTFGGREWEKMRDVRRYSTGLIAAINYGPSLRNMDWLRDLEDFDNRGPGKRGAYKANPCDDPSLEAALDSFEECLGDDLRCDVFQKFGEVSVARSQVQEWGEKWRMDTLTEEGRKAAWSRVRSGARGDTRAQGLDLVRFAATHHSNTENDAHETRRIMSNTHTIDFPTSLRPYAEDWRQMQVRQVFRLALEGLLYWALGQLENGPLTTEKIANRFLEEAGLEDSATPAKEWLSEVEFDTDPIQQLDALSEALAGEASFAETAISALCFCIHEAPAKAEVFERNDRLPIVRAVENWRAWSDRDASGFVSNIFEGWIFAQHTYWSVGRGLQDARRDGKTILRLRLFIDEGGWRLANGMSRGNPPNPTPDRIETALSLLRECDQL